MWRPPRRFVQVALLALGTSASNGFLPGLRGLVPVAASGSALISFLTPFW